MIRLFYYSLLFALLLSCSSFACSVFAGLVVSVYLLVLSIVLNFLSGLFASLFKRGLLVTPFVSLRWDLGLVAGKCDKSEQGSHVE